MPTVFGRWLFKKTKLGSQCIHTIWEDTEARHVIYVWFRSNLEERNERKVVGKELVELQ